jgi:hypothetical protein
MFFDVPGGVPDGEYPGPVLAAAAAVVGLGLGAADAVVVAVAVAVPVPVCVAVAAFGYTKKAEPPPPSPQSVLNLLPHHHTRCRICAGSHRRTPSDYIVFSYKKEAEYTHMSSHAVNQGKMNADGSQYVIT